MSRRPSDSARGNNRLCPDYGFREIKTGSLAEYAKGHFVEGETLLRDALKYARESGADRDIAMDLSALGDIYHSELRRNEAALAYKEALSIFSHLPDGTLLEAITLRNLASVYSGQQRYREGLTALGKASKLTAKNKIGGDVFAAQILNTFGVIYFAQGELKQAETSFRRAAQIWRAPGTKPNLDLAQSLHNLAVLLQRRGKYRDAVQQVAANHCRTFRTFASRSVAHSDQLRIVVFNNGALQRWRESIATESRNP